ncbi:MAG: type II secretion system F family protein [Bdellovibrionota bacterium]
MLKVIGSLFFGAAVFGVSYHYNKRFLEWLRFQSLGTRDYIVNKLSLMFIDIPQQRILIWMFLLSFGAGLLVFFAFLPNFFPGITFGIVTTIVGWKAPKPIVDFIYDRRVKKFVLQMVDALSLMSNGLKAGLSPVQSLALVSEQMPNPIHEEFNYVLQQTKLGASLEEALLNLSKRVQADDVEMFVTSVIILKETGGNLAETFDTIVTTIRERIKLENKISAMTTQGMAQGVIVMMIPPVLGMVFYQSDPEFMKPLFSTTLGWAIIMLIILLEIVGFFVMRKIVRIEV